jgi:hypothetical protein
MSNPSNLPATFEQLPAVKNQVELNQALNKLRQSFNVLVPAQMNFSSPMHKVALEAVQLDATVDSKKNGIDIYSPDGSDKFTLHYKAANKIAGAAGINWTKSYAAKREVGGDGRVIYVEHVVEWEVKKINGSTKKGVTTGHYRYEEDKAKLAANPKQIETRRRFAEGLAESNAKLRAIFEALEQLPRHFSLDDLKKPFLVPCVVEDINELAKDDPEIRKMIVANALGIVDQVFGPQSQQRETKADPNALTGVRAEVVDESTNKGVGIGPGGELILDLKTEAGFKQHWMLKSTDERDAEIKKLLKEKEVEFPKGTIFGEMAIARQVEALWYYNNLPTPEKKSALPWEKGGQA